MGLMEGAANSALGAGLGMLTANWQDRRQLEQQEKLTEQQVAAQAKMMGISYDLAMKMWNETNYSAQVDQLKKAKLNVGLMYKGAGQGGTTQMPSGSVTGGTAAAGSGEIGMGMQIGMQKALQEAQIENIKADTEKKKVEAAKTGGVDTTAVGQQILESEARIKAIQQSVTNQQTQNAINLFMKDVAEVQARYATESQEAAIGQLKASTTKLIEDTVQQAQQNKITGETMDEVIKQATLTMIGQSLNNELTREKLITEQTNRQETWSKISRISAEIERMQAQTEQGERGLNQNDAKLIMEQIGNEFNYGDEAKVLRWINAIGGALGDVMKIRKGGK